jgi:TPR repeat protein
MRPTNSTQLPIDHRIFLRCTFVDGIRGLVLLLSSLCASGLVADTPPVSAADLIARAQAGSAWDQLNLGAAYDHGRAGFPLDPVRAVAWYRRAAEAGLAEAQFNLAHCLATGNGTPRDDAEALAWMLKAAEQDLASAQYLVGVMLLEGIGGAADRGRAVRWLERAALNGNSDAASLLQRLRDIEPVDQDR